MSLLTTSKDEGDEDLGCLEENQDNDHDQDVRFVLQVPRKVRKRVASVALARQPLSTGPCTPNDSGITKKQKTAPLSCAEPHSSDRQPPQKAMSLSHQHLDLQPPARPDLPVQSTQSLVTRPHSKWNSFLPDDDDDEGL